MVISCRDDHLCYWHFRKWIAYILATPPPEILISLAMDIDSGLMRSTAILNTH